MSIPTPLPSPVSIPFARSAFNYDRDQASRLAGLACLDESLTVQASKDECDINVIVARFGVTGQLPTPTRMPSYGDFSGINDYQTAMETLVAADQAFMTLPSKLRDRFRNDPQLLLEFLGDERNRAEAVSLGLVNPPAGAAASPAGAGAPAGT